MFSVDINSDLGEGFGDYKMADDAAILKLITSANIACGFHAGDPMTMNETARLAVERGVSIGAHIGYPDRQGFGRRQIVYELKELELMTLYQLGALRAVVENVNGTLTHANFHGALGNLSFLNYDVAYTLLSAVKAFDPALKFVALPFTQAYEAAQKLGIEVVESFLADRAYTKEGVLVSRKVAGSVIHEPQRIRERVQRVLQEGRLDTIDGVTIQMPARSILVHSDTAGAIDIAHTIRQAVLDIGCKIESFR